MTHAANVPEHDDDARLASLGYQPQLRRVLGLFANFSVAFTYLSPMVGIYSLFALGLGTGGPAYIWLNLIPIAGMLFVALVFGELASHYPVAGALYQYSKFSVGPGYGWFVGWFYGFALLITVAAVDTGVVTYFAALTHNWFGWSLDPADHVTILWITVLLLLIQTALNITGAKVMGRVAQFGVYVEILGTFGIAVILAVHGFHHGLGYLFTTQGVQHAASNPLGLNFHGSWLGAALIAVLAPVYIYYGFESAGDISEETVDAGRQVPRAMRLAVIWGGIGSIVLTAALLLAVPGHGAKGVGDAVGGGVPFILGQLPSGVQDILLLLIIFAFFSCGTSIQGAGSRLMFSYSRDQALPGSSWLARVHPRFGTPVNALVAGSMVTVLFVLLVFASPAHDKHFLFITYPGGVNALVALVSFGVSGIYLSFLMTVIASWVARSRGWVPEGRFTLGRWGNVVTLIAGAYLALMLVNVVLPTGLSSPRAYFNIDWITLLVMFLIAVVGAAYFLAARPDRGVRHHLHDDREPTGAERETPPA
ncbi:MAG TPA: amino acid permease [Nocardioides sp.]|uniref:APC family permease n=1 Tax=Nocardioides sp. TaxID=35761 RepID=UPI002E319490|nr:amino acid permease [Nocardioides sp.]HEX3932640.1 amino acid permease [Nocardioides sp.]